METITFAKGNLKSTLSQRVENYFTSQNIDKSGNWLLYSKTIILFCSLIGTFSIIFLSHTLWIEVLMYALLGFIVATIGFNVMHDAAHGSYSKNKKLNASVAFLGADLMGGSSYTWKIQHNILHHSYTNIEGMDEDIAKYPIFRLNAFQKRLWFHKYQYLYGTILYMFTTLNWMFFDDYVKFTKLIKEKKSIKNKGSVIFFFILGKILNITIFLIIPLCFVHTWWHALIGFFIMHAVLGITLAFVFQLAHVVQETIFREPPTIEQWALHQIQTTANFAMDNKIICWLVGGLNFQVEHHLFANISHVHYPALSKVIQQTCKDLGITYHAFPTFGKALSSHFAHLYEMGRR